MTGVKTKSGLNRYACSRFPECAWLWAHSGLRDEVRTSSPDAEKQVTRAQDLVRLHVLGRVPYRGGGSEFLASLLRQGYSRESVIEALADAWQAERDHFELPRRSRMTWIHTLWARLLISLLITAWLVGVGVKYLAHVNPELDRYLITIPPLLSFVALPVLVVVFLVVNWLLGLWTPKAPGAAS